MSVYTFISSAMSPLSQDITCMLVYDALGTDRQWGETLKLESQQHSPVSQCSKQAMQLDNSICQAAPIQCIHVC